MVSEWLRSFNLTIDFILHLRNDCGGGIGKNSVNIYFVIFQKHQNDIIFCL